MPVGEVHLLETTQFSTRLTTDQIQILELVGRLKNAFLLFRSWTIGPNAVESALERYDWQLQSPLHKGTIGSCKESA